MQPFHHRPTVFLVKAETLVRRHPLFPRLRTVAVNFPQTLQHVAALLRKIRCHLHEIATVVGSELSASLHDSGRSGLVTSVVMLDRARRTDYDPQAAVGCTGRDATNLPAI